MCRPPVSFVDGLVIAADLVNMPVVMLNTDFLAVSFWHGQKVILAVPLFIFCIGCFYSFTTDI